MITTENRVFPAVAIDGVPIVDRETMVEIDRLAVEEFGVSLPKMMEQAGSHLAELVRVELGGDLVGRRVIVASGAGNNGAGGLAAARHLVNRGASVRVMLARPVNRLSAAGRDQLATLLQMSVDCCVAIYDVADDELERELDDAHLVVDSLLGYGADGPPRDGVRWLIERIGRMGLPVVSLDLPSGVDPDTGETPGVTVAAAATLTLAVPKHGLFRSDGARLAGRIHLADLGLPHALYRRLGLEFGSPFVLGRIVHLDASA